MDWNKVYKDNAPKLLGVCRRYIKDINRAEDVMHDGFIQAINKFETFKGKGSFEGWLHRVVINTALQDLRRNKITNIQFETIEHSKLNSTLNFNAIEMDAFEKDANWLEGLEVSFLMTVIDDLPDHHKKVFNLYVIDGFKHRQIAEMLDISVGTSKSHLARARKSIQKLLKIKYEEKERKVAALPWYLMITPKANLDKIFSNKFANYTLKPQRNIDLGSYLNNSGSVVSLPRTSSLAITPVMLIGIGIIGAIFLLSQYDSTSESKNILTENQDILNVEKTESAEVVNELKIKSISNDNVEVSTPEIVKIDSKDENKNIEKSSVLNEKTNVEVVEKEVRIPVVVREKLIIRDTVEIDKKK